MYGQNFQQKNASSISRKAYGRPHQTTLNELPSPDTKRWVIKRKAAVVSAVKSGLITRDDACQRYDISTDEFLIWQEMLEKHGVRGLRVTKLQEFRVS